jgi:hypothetical protein
MPSLNIDLNFFDHPKVKRLRALVGPEAEIYIIRLWAYAGKFHSEDGILKGYSGPEIEGLAEWKGKPGVMLQAMLKVGFIESGNRIHDWAEHEGHLLVYKARARVANAARWKKHSLEKNASSNPKGVVKESPISSVQYSSVQDKALTTTAPDKPDAGLEGQKPVNWANCKSPIQRIIARYVELGQPALFAHATQAEATGLFKEQGKAVGPIMAQCGGNVDTAVRVVELAAAYYGKKGLDWSLYAVAKNCGDFLNTVKKEHNYGANR